LEQEFNLSGIGMGPHSSDWKNGGYEMTYNFSDRELSIVLCALRFWQRKHPTPYSCCSEGWMELDEICEVEGLEPLSLVEIDDLCERINE
jgi:hypothetical protein